MATFFKLTILLSFATLLFLASYSPLMASSSSVFDQLDQEDEEEYVLDNQVPNPRLGAGRFLGSSGVIKKGTHCDPLKYNVCNGVWANKGKSFLHCCKNHCRNVLGDKNNCGRCGNKCKFGEHCCGGRCTNVLSNVNHCGKCDKKCKGSVRCEYGYCGYA